MAKTKELKPLSSTVTNFHPYSRFISHPFYQDPDTKKRFIGVWNPPRFPAKQTDISYQVTSRNAFRPDLISYEFYDTPFLAWVICYVNDIINPWDRETGLYAGRIITVTDITTITTILNF